MYYFLQQNYTHIWIFVVKPQNCPRERLLQFLYDLTQALGLNHYGLWGLSNTVKVKAAAIYLSGNGLIPMSWPSLLPWFGTKTSIGMVPIHKTCNGKKHFSAKISITFLFFYYIWVSQSTFFFGVENAMNINLKISPFWKLYQLSFFLFT